MDTGRNKTYFPELTLLRCLAAFLVILVHVSAYGFYSGSEHWLLSVIYNSLGRNAVPVFFMISGALMIPREEALKDWALKGLRRVLIPYCFWAFAYVLFVMLTENRRDVSLNIALAAPYYHLPFMLHYLSYYLALPLLRGFWNHSGSRRGVKLYVAAASLVFMVLSDFLPQLLGRSILSLSLITAPQYAAFALFGAFLWGSRRGSVLNDPETVTRSKRRNAFLWLLLTLAGMGLTVFFTWRTTRRVQSPSESFFVYSSPFIVASAAGLFLFFRDLGLKDMRNIRRYEWASAHTFRVYLIHPMLLTLLIRFAHITWNLFFPPIWIPVYSALLYLLCLLISALIEKLSPSHWSGSAFRQRRIVLSAFYLIMIISASLFLKHGGVLPAKKAAAPAEISEDLPVETSEAMYHSFDVCELREDSLLIRGWAIEVGTDSREASVFLEFQGSGGDTVRFDTTPYFSTYLRDQLDPDGAYDWAFFECSIPLEMLKPEVYSVSVLVKGKGFWRSAARYTVDLSA